MLGPVPNRPPAPGGTAAAGPRPAVVFTHGGCQRQMYAAFHYGLDYALLYAQNQSVEPRAGWGLIFSR